MQNGKSETEMNARRADAAEQTQPGTGVPVRGAERAGGAQHAASRGDARREQNSEDLGEYGPAELAALLREAARALCVSAPEVLHQVADAFADPLRGALAGLRSLGDPETWVQPRGEDVVALEMALRAMGKISEDGRMPTVLMLQALAGGVVAQWRFEFEPDLRPEDADILSPVATPVLPATVLIIRDPDCENGFYADGKVEYVEIDLGNGFTGRNGFRALSPEEQAGYIAGWLGKVNRLPADSAVRRRVEELVSELSSRNDD